MKEPISIQEKSLQEKLGELLRTNRLAILLEIVVVLLPMYLGLIINDRSGTDHIPLGSNVVMLGGPAMYLGMIISLLLLWITSRLRGAGWGDFGLTRPKSWFRTVLMSLGVAFVILGAVVLLINPIIKALPNVEPRDMSRFSYLTGNLPNLIIQLVIIWITAAFLEEFFFRGYLLNRLVDLQGRQTKLAWVIAVAGQALIFGLAHAYQGPVGIFRTGAIGLVFGFAYLAVGRNLWPLILAHGLIDTIDMVTHYFGG
jgi:membrane protease YdiL (CAAX protease family)